jgi:hypothetical protein
LIRKRKASLLVLALAVLVSVPAAYSDDGEHDGPFQRVLLISIDGMHAVDFANCAANNTCPNVAELATHGVTYTRASASKPSDSFPGLTNIVTGGTPKTHGAFYDLAYDRSLQPPKVDTGNGLLHGSCTPGQMPIGTTTEYEEGVEVNQSSLDGGVADSFTKGGWLSIDKDKLPRDPKTCNPVYPWNFIRVNTIFGVIHDAGLRTAWSDKHAVYASVSGHTNTTTPINLDDYYSPEINSKVVALPGVTTPHTPSHPMGVACSPVRDTSQTGSWTDSFANIQCYDTLKVNAVLNWIQGKALNGKSWACRPFSE